MTLADTITVWRKRLRIADARQAAWSSAVGAGLGVLPIPGLQVVVGGVLAWRWRLHLPLVLAAINIGFGPLFLWWGAMAVGCGRWLRTGEGPGAIWADLHAGWADGFWHHVPPVLGDWLLGCLVVVPMVATATGLLTLAVVRRHLRSTCGRR